MRTRVSWVWPIVWIPVFALNLIVPFGLSSAVIDQRGQIGINVAIALYGTLGLGACAANLALGRALVVGGLIVASTQFMVVLQMGAGFAAVMIWSWLGGAGINAELDGFMLTIITGGLLLGVALVIGRLVDSTNSSKERSDDRQGQAVS